MELIDFLINKIVNKLKNTADEFNTAKGKVGDVIDKIKKEVGGDMQNFFYGKCENPNRADECFSDLWTELFRSAINGCYNAQRPLRPYLYGIARNLIRGGPAPPPPPPPVPPANPLSVAQTHEVQKAAFEELVSLAESDPNLFLAVITNHCLSIPEREAGGILSKAAATIDINRKKGLTRIIGALRRKSYNKNERKKGLDALKGII